MLPLWNQQPLHVAHHIFRCSACVPFPRPGLHESLRLYDQKCSFRSLSHSRSHERDEKSRLSGFWAPSGGIAMSADEDAHSKLVRAGFLRQAHSGIFHMLPLGHRVQGKVERLIDKHMYNLGASRLDLSSISSEYLWRKSGRLTKVNSELFRFKDRKGTGYLLSPTHEEEITDLVASTVRSYKELPARIYQISRKYRDELRPRHGLLRSREFVMKDLYTFDYNISLALATYGEVRKAYASLFDELKIPYLVAEADSGDMGGNLSHEFHFLTPKGEDHVISCGHCDYVANEELVQSPISTSYDVQDYLNWSFMAPEQLMYPSNTSLGKAFSVWRGLSRDRSTLVNVWYALKAEVSTATSMASAQPEINTHAVQAIIPTLDPGVENAAALWTQKIRLPLPPEEDGQATLPKIVNLVDYRLPATVLNAISSGDRGIPFWPRSADQMATEVTSTVISRDPSSNEPLNLMRIRNGDICPRCGESQLRVQKAIELGHTFFLGTRYSEPFKAFVTLPAEHLKADRRAGSMPPSNTQVPMQMGCHGIGVSRMIGAVAEALADEKGLNWPRVIAPYEAIVVPVGGYELDAVSVYDALITEHHNHKVLDVVLDDRAHPFAWKMRDADLIGYPVIVVVGRGWNTDRTCEVQCRRLGVRENVPFEGIFAFVESLLVQL